MSRFSRSNQRLNGLNPLAYLGDNSYQPPEFVTDNRPPTSTDAQNFELGTIWLDTFTNTPPTAENVWMLVGLLGGVATWVNFEGGNALETLTGNSGGPVSGDVNDNINIIGDGTTINIVGTPLNNTLTVSVSGTGVLSGLRTQDFNVVTPTAGIINVIGAGLINTTGTVGPNTVTINAADTIAASFPTDIGTATPSFHTLNILGGANITTSAPGSSNTVRVAVSGTTNHTVQLGNSTGSLNSLANGTTGQVLTAQTGADPIWASVPVAGISSVAMQVFTSNGTYTPTVGMVYCIIEVVGGGGGGGSTESDANEAAAAGGGGAGGYSRGIYSAATIGASKAVTIGAGGAGGAGGTGGNGSAGGTTSVGALLQATGGGGATYGSSRLGFNTTFGGQGGVGSGGSVNSNGGYGGTGIEAGNNVTGGNYLAAGGFGGNSYFGGGARGASGGGAPGMTNGANGTAYGGGGSGAETRDASGIGTGGTGFAGVVVITEFVS